MARTYDEYNRVILDTQHPDADIDYVVSFANELSARSDGDTIDTATAVAERGLTIHDVVYDTERVVFWASGGQRENRYIIKVTANTTEGRTYVYELVLPVGHEQLSLEE